MKGLIFDIKHFAVHDGTGIRTTVFFKGCPLNCWWCHNPESIGREPQVMLRKRKLGNMVFEEKNTVGEFKDVDTILEEIEKDSIFYEESSGGVTFSGGEPLLQNDFLLNLIQSCHQRGIHTALDTSGYSKMETLKKVMPFIDLFLFDVKLLDDSLHKKYTGVSNKIILENLNYLLEQKKRVIIRYPIIPGINNSKEQLQELKQYLTGKFNEVHFLPYHKIASHKYDQLGMKYKMSDTEPLPESYLFDLKEDFKNHGFKVKIGG